jgi:Zn-dependent protease/CBS domain-containing protein
MGSGFEVGRILGIQIVIDWSLAIIFTLIVTSLGAGVFPAWHPDWSPMTSWLTAFFAASLFFVSVLLHELSHAVVGRAQGMKIERITLFVFGGMAHIEREPQAWRAELWMAIVGPITSLIIGVACITLGGLLAPAARFDPADPHRFYAELGPVATLLFWVGPVNVLLALFNLVPGFPLDGGRVLRALLWGITGSLKRATRWASRCGQVFAWVLIASGVAMILGLRVPIFGTGLVPGLWLAFIGWFLHSAALMSYRQLLVKEALEDVPVSRLMQTDFATVPGDLSLEALVDRYFAHSDQRAYPVMDGGRLVGLACLKDVRTIPREEWAARRVRDIMTAPQDVVCVSPREDAMEAMQLLNGRNLNQLLVVEKGKVRGLFRREDILKWLALHGDEGLERGGQA